MAPQTGQITDEGRREDTGRDQDTRVLRELSGMNDSLSSKSARVTGQPLSKLGRPAVQRDPIQRHGRKVKLGGDLRTVPALVLVCQVVPGAASPTCSRLAVYRWGNQLCGKAFGQVGQLRVERTNQCCHPLCRAVTISLALLTNVAAPVATSCRPHGWPASAGAHISTGRP